MSRAALPNRELPRQARRVGPTATRAPPTPPRQSATLAPANTPCAVALPLSRRHPSTRPRSEDSTRVLGLRPWACRAAARGLLGALALQTRVNPRAPRRDHA